MDLDYHTRHRRKQQGRKVFGVVIATAGILLLLHTLHIFEGIDDYFHEGWPVLLVAIGAVIGIRSRFRHNGWWILVLIGGVHLLQPYFFPDIPSHRIIWPGLLIFGGLSMLVRKEGRQRFDSAKGGIISNDADTINIDVTFGGRKEIVTSRAFRGGTIRATFAGAEINLAAADSDVQPMILDVHASFASIEIIVPSHWEIQNEINPTMGSVEDQRMVRTTDTADEKRTLILRGSCSFGSVEIKSY